MDQTRKARNFRPTSLSIVTVTPEMHKSLEQLRISNNTILSGGNIEEIKSEDEIDEYDYDTDDFDVENLEQTQQNQNQSRLKNRRPTPGDIQVISVDAAQFKPNINFDEFYVHDSRQANMGQDYRTNVIVVQSNQPRQNQTKSIMSNNSHRHGRQQQTNNPIYNVQNDIFKLDSLSVSSNSDTRKPPSILKHTKDGDDTSIGDCSIGASSENSHANKEHNLNMSILMNQRLIKLLSILYGLVVVMLGAIITAHDISHEVNNLDHLYSIVITFIGLCFLIFIHVDVQKHKRFVVDWENKQKEKIESPLRSSANDCDSVSVTTAIIFNRNYNIETDEIDEETKQTLSSYKFITGKHSGSFYLKVGMTLFCMGSIVHQGINFGIQIHFFLNDVEECTNLISFVVYFIRCIFAFYQLYMAFKYSNLIINRHQYIVRFGLMHLLGTSLSFWFSTIIEEAMEGYMDKVNVTDDFDVDSPDLVKHVIKHHLFCSNETLAHFESLDLVPYLYPFSIEYNIILASVWYIVWTNIGNKDSHSELHHVREEINEDKQTGEIDVSYRSNVSINIDLHASNIGIFGGLLMLLIILVSTTVFSTTIRKEEYKEIGIFIYTAQFGLLTLSTLITTPLAFKQTRKLNVVNVHHLDNSTTAMDDLLLIVPIPFYIVHHILCIYAELKAVDVNGILMAIIYSMHLIQVGIQTPFIIDGLRRCSKEKQFRRKKPGKGLITFIMIINVVLWILITLEIKMVDKYHSMPAYFGKFVWMIVLDTCLPLMLFYRFHSSVCLSDIWKHAYEKDSH